ncbi:hypothetical protein BDC45DRAFT_446841, partial [Circinella umbellata]
SMKPNENMSDQGKVFLAISKHVLSSFHLAHRSTPVFMLNHEHTSLCEDIVPSLLPLSKMTGFLEFRWCEAPFNATKSNYLKEGDYDAAKNIDALGLLKTQSNMELVIVEASSGILKEHTTHTIEDSLKILECSVASLRREAANYKFSSLETFKKLNTYGIQIIKSKITLSKTSLYNKNQDQATHPSHIFLDDTWKHVEMRTAEIPTTWHNRIILLKYLELLATLSVCVQVLG